MRLYDAAGTWVGIMWERPITPTTNERIGRGHVVTMSAPCESCGELTIRERCTSHAQAHAPGDRDGGYFSPWAARCLECELRLVKTAGLKPRLASIMQ